jgi:hypothetical protein
MDVPVVLATTPTAPTISHSETIVLLALVVAGTMVAGLLVILARRTVPAGDNEPAASVVRSWIAISLVFGLLVFCAAAFRIGDSTLRSTLFGGLIASVGAAVAFYFSSKSADQARSDILKTALAISQGGTSPTTFFAASPPAGQVDAEYATYKFLADGQPTPTYTRASGSIPPGLTLDTDGTLHGTPTSAPGNFTFSILAQNSAGELKSDDITIAIQNAAQ